MCDHCGSDKIEKTVWEFDETEKRERPYAHCECGNVYELDEEKIAHDLPYPPQIEA